MTEDCLWHRSPSPLSRQCRHSSSVQRSEEEDEDERFPDYEHSDSAGHKIWNSQLNHSLRPKHLSFMHQFQQVELVYHMQIQLNPAQTDFKGVTFFFALAKIQLLLMKEIIDN